MKTHAVHLHNMDSLEPKQSKYPYIPPTPRCFWLNCACLRSPRKKERISSNQLYCDAFLRSKHLESDQTKHKSSISVPSGSVCHRLQNNAVPINLRSIVLSVVSMKTFIRSNRERQHLVYVFIA